MAQSARPIVQGATLRKPLNFEAEQLAGPGRALPAEFGGHRERDALQLGETLRVHLGLAVEGALVEKASSPPQAKRRAAFTTVDGTQGRERPAGKGVPVCI